jgi:hypothetical protein
MGMVSVVDAEFIAVLGATGHMAGSILAVVGDIQAVFF